MGVILDESSLEPKIGSWRGREDDFQQAAHYDLKVFWQSCDCYIPRDPLNWSLNHLPTVKWRKAKRTGILWNEPNHYSLDYRDSYPRNCFAQFLFAIKYHQGFPV